jgi:hypothetical protein
MSVAKRWGKVRLGWVSWVMRIRRGFWVIAPSLFHLTTWINRHVDIIECRKLKIWVYSNHLWRNDHTKFHKSPYRHYRLPKCVQTDTTCKGLVCSTKCKSYRYTIWCKSLTMHSLYITDVSITATCFGQKFACSS